MRHPERTSEPASSPEPTADPAASMYAFLQRIATGPELSKDLSREEARLGMRLVLDGAVDPVQAGVFLIALRMKRETDEENQGVLEAVREATERVTAPVDEILDLADPYDGYTRSLPASPFLPAVLAACGVPSFSHGVERVGPKLGVTHRQVLRAAGAPVDGSVADAAARLADRGIGWAYLDQSVFCPKLNRLIGLRELIVKRPVITTVEGMAGALRGRERTHLVSGYVHKPYPRIYTALARHAGYDTALLVRGTEGGVIPSLRQTGKWFFYRERAAGEDGSMELSPTEIGIEQTLRAVPLPEDGPAAEAAAAAGRAALEGRPGPTRDALVYGGALCLWHAGRHARLAEAADAVREALAAGRALAHFEAGCQRGVDSRLRES